MAAELEQEEQFGPYLVYERLGVGGMATVHRALERGIEGFERIVALKRLLPHLAEDASFIKSFVREAKLASALNHVNIVQIFELGRVSSEYFISMEYIDGRDIRRILRHARKVTGPPPINVTVGILLQLCDALDYAHNKSDERGVPMQLVHRDVSPSNLIVTSAGHVKVIDFGIAKAQSQQLRTQTGRVKGKLAYMAPEAISGRELDARSDLFAVGVIAHEMLTARPLFASKNEYQTLLKVQRGDIMPPSTFNQTCQPELDAIVLKALARDPDERFSSAAELREELLAMRRTYNLATSYRDISSWVDWAFSIEPSPSAAANNDASGVSEVREPVIRHKTPSPRAEDEEAVEIAWGGGDPEQVEGGPVLLDDVPDVSEKHLRDQIRVEVDDSELMDNMPTPVPPVAQPPSQPPRARRGTAPGHTPASQPRPERIGRHSSGRMQTQTTDPEGNSLEVLLREAADNADTHLSMPQAADTQPSLPQIEASMPQVPVVRFKATTPPPIAGQAVRTVSTKPGYAPARAVTASVDEDAATLAPSERGPKAKLSAPRIGKAMIARREAGPKRWWLILAGIVAAGAIATAITLALTRGADTIEPAVEKSAPRIAPEKAASLVKFMLEPADAEIAIDGKHVHAGSPWQTELDPGIYQLQITREGYKAWLTTLELSPGEPLTLRAVLAPLDKAAPVAEATLILTPSQDGLEAILDGTVLPTKTPLKMPIKAGPHTIVLRNNGVEVWRHDMVAQANADYEFSPSMDAEKQRERAQRSERRPARVEDQFVPPGTPAPVPPVDAAPAVEPVKPPEPATVPPPDARPTPPPAPPDAAVSTTRPVAPPAPPPAPARPTGPVTVPPSAVTKLSGSSPEIAKLKNADLPDVVAAKICISHTGRVASVDLITKIDPRAARAITETIQGWTYAPYKQYGVATAACFAISFRLK